MITSFFGFSDTIQPIQPYMWFKVLVNEVYVCKIICTAGISEKKKLACSPHLPLFFLCFSHKIAATVYISS
jgi:hypothetical protein